MTETPLSPIGDHDKLIAETLDHEMELLLLSTQLNKFFKGSDAVVMLSLIARKAAYLCHPSHGAPPDAAEFFDKLLAAWRRRAEAKAHKVIA